MTELEMIKAFAELDGLHFNDKLVSENGSIWASFMDGGCYGWYNPITDYALTFKAMIDYDVQKLTSIYDDGLKLHTIHIKESSRVNALSNEELPKGIIECILKSKGLWKKENINDRFNLE